MSTKKHNRHHTSHAHNHGHGHDHTHGHGSEAPHGSLKSYTIGFVLSVILTAIPFWLVMGKVLSSNLATTLVIMGFAVVQMVVHMVFFLHMHPKSEGGWNMLALFFTLIVVIISMSGSMWVMFHLNSNMMPVHDMSNMSNLQQQAAEPGAISETTLSPQTEQLP